MTELSLDFLGTSASMPSVKRGLTATLLTRDGERFLFDCGEGTQRQMMKGPGLKAPRAIFLTHYHPDHWLGLSGLLASLKLMEHMEPVTIYGPADGIGTAEMVCQRTGGGVDFASFVGVEPGDFAYGDSVTTFSVKVFKTKHTPNSVGYVFEEKRRPGRFDPEEARRLGVEPGPDFGRLQRDERVILRDRTVYPYQVMGSVRPGRKIVITGDTAPCRETAEAAQGADVLVHEATFTRDMVARAKQTKHSTAQQAALVAEKAGVGRLFLNHFSTRTEPKLVAQEAAQIFNPVQAVNDGYHIKIPFKE